MSKRNKERKKRRSVSHRYKHSHEHRGSVSTGIFEFTDNVKYYKMEEGTHYLLIIPYEIRSKKHPLVAKKEPGFVIGEADYVLDIFTHRRIGPGDQDIVCLKENYGKACPICEEAARKKNDGDAKGYDTLKPSRRVFYNVIDAKKPENGLQVLSQSHFLFEKELIEEAGAEEDGDEFKDFAGEECVIKFRASKEKRGGFEFFEFKSFSFKEREKYIDEYKEEWLENAIPFDEFLKILSYQEIESILYGTSIEDEDEDEDDEDESVPSKKNRKKEQSIEKKSRNNDEDEDEDEEVKSKSSSENKSSKSKCPYGYKFGIDTDDTDKCDDCEEWDACDEEKIEKNRSKK